MSAATLGRAGAANAGEGRAWLRKVWMRFQRARLEAAMRGFTDAQLAQIGVTREGVAEHARQLVEERG
ncbi:hypothetical protein [Rubrimonas cliftonensis]|uniref:DUF1127 domain-containing protein n=1 Tax=Rubrimonas cliftonensis TaxID=89524 RepID=A0A1H4BEA7_9RHOB|nr:hypothetical protein [Rubrimonas cliftonensis]SEA46489.1 hypothetical protein SAMN05444370_105163 [Rubrimonas cliftonensis]